MTFWIDVPVPRADVSPGFRCRLLLANLSACSISFDHLPSLTTANPAPQRLASAAPMLAELMQNRRGADDGDLSSRQPA